MNMPKKSIGILGGMGPLATIDRGMVLPEGSLVRCGQVVMLEGLQNQPYESDKT